MSPVEAVVADSNVGSVPEEESEATDPVLTFTSALLETETEPAGV